MIYNQGDTFYPEPFVQSGVLTAAVDWSLVKSDGTFTVNQTAMSKTGTLWYDSTGVTLASSNATYTVFYREDSGEYIKGEKVIVVAGDRIQKNVAISNFQFFMQDSSGVAVTGLSITSERSIDGAAFAATTNSAAEISDGWYDIDLSAADLNGDTIALRFSGTGAIDATATIVTET